MKKNYLLILLLLFMFRASGQNCNYSYQTNPGTTIVNFSPNPAFSPNMYYFVWSFGDGSSDSTAFPSHAYNGVGPYVACYEIFSYATGLRVCTACDSVYLGSSTFCSYTYTNNGTFFTFVSAGNPQGGVTWDFGDNGVGFGPAVNYVYQNPGVYNVTMTVTDTTNGFIICQYTQTVTAPGSGSGCSFTTTSQGPIVTFTATNVSPNTLVTWDFGDGMVGGGNQITHPYAATGSYYVCMTATDVFGSPCSFCQVVNVTTNPGNCYFTATPDSMSPGIFYFNAIPAYPNSYIMWDFGDGSTGAGVFSAHTYSVPGIYNVCITESDSLGILCTSCQVVLVQTPSPCFFSYSASILNPLAINFQANGGNTITWDFGDGFTDTGSAVSHTYLVPGIYNVCISTGTPGTPNFCNYCDIVSVGNTNNFCNLTFYPDPLQPNTFVFSSTQSSPSSFIMWDFGDNTTGTGQTVTHTFNAPGHYIVCVTERDSSQNILCQNCLPVQVGGGGGGVVCQASFLATSFGLDGYFIDLSYTNSPFMQYAWDFGDGSTSNLQFPNHTYASPGLYNVCLTVNDSSCSDMFCAPLLIDTNAINPGNGCNAFYAFMQLAPYQVTVLNLSSGLNLSFDWDFGDGSPHDTNPYPSHVYTNTGSYNLCLTVFDPNGCTSTYCDTMSVDSLGNIYRMASPGFTINVLSPAMLTGVKEVSAENAFGVYPNPFTSELRISLLNSSKKAENYRIFSVQGAEIMRGKMEGANGIINTQSLSSGVYLLEITMNDGSRSFQRVMKN